MDPNIDVTYKYFYPNDSEGNIKILTMFKNGDYRVYKIVTVSGFKKSLVEDSEKLQLFIQSLTAQDLLPFIDSQKLPSQININDLFTAILQWINRLGITINSDILNKSMLTIININDILGSLTFSISGLGEKREISFKNGELFTHTRERVLNLYNGLTWDDFQTLVSEGVVASNVAKSRVYNIIINIAASKNLDESTRQLIRLGDIQLSVDDYLGQLTIILKGSIRIMSPVEAFRSNKYQLWRKVNDQLEYYSVLGSGNSIQTYKRYQFPSDLGSSKGITLEELNHKYGININVDISPSNSIVLTFDVEWEDITDSNGQILIKANLSNPRGNFSALKFNIGVVGFKSNESTGVLSEIQEELLNNKYVEIQKSYEFSGGLLLVTNDQINLIVTKENLYPPIIEKDSEGNFDTSKSNVWKSFLDKMINHFLEKDYQNIIGEMVYSTNNTWSKGVISSYINLVYSGDLEGKEAYSNIFVAPLRVGSIINRDFKVRLFSKFSLLFEDIKEEVNIRIKDILNDLSNERNINLIELKEKISYVVGSDLSSIAPSLDKAELKNKLIESLSLFDSLNRRPESKDILSPNQVWTLPFEEKILPFNNISIINSIVENGENNIKEISEEIRENIFNMFKNEDGTSMKKYNLETQINRVLPKSFESIVEIPYIENKEFKNSQRNIKNISAYSVLSFGPVNIFIYYDENGNISNAQLFNPLQENQKILLENTIKNIYVSTSSNAKKYLLKIEMTNDVNYYIQSNIESNELIFQLEENKHLTEASYCLQINSDVIVVNNSQSNWIYKQVILPENPISEFVDDIFVRTQISNLIKEETNATINGMRDINNGMKDINFQSQKQNPTIVDYNLVKESDYEQINITNETVYNENYLDYKISINPLDSNGQPINWKWQTKLSNDVEYIYDFTPVTKQSIISRQILIILFATLIPIFFLGIIGLIIGLNKNKIRWFVQWKTKRTNKNKRAQQKNQKFYQKGKSGNEDATLDFVGKENNKNK